MYAGSISDAYLRQCPACSWIVDAGHRFVQVYGDTTPLFGAAAEAIDCRMLGEGMRAERATAWRERVERCLAGETLLLRERIGTFTWYVAQFPMSDDRQSRFAGGFGLDVTPWSSAEQELRYTVLSALRAQGFERASMSKFLHDQVGQNLSAAGLQLDLLRMDLETVSPDACRHITDVQRMLESVMQQVRDFSYQLNPAMVERAGLHAALDRLLGRARSRFQGTVRLILSLPRRWPRGTLRRSTRSLRKPWRTR